MSSFELQTYKNGQWIIDSYYDDRELALSEAERLDVTGRHAGVRILMEEYHEPTNTSNYQVIYSRLKKDSVKKDSPRRPVRGTVRQGSESGRGTGMPRATRRPPPQAKTGGGSIAVPVLIAVLLLIAGVGTMLALHNDLDIAAAINSLTGAKSR